MSLSEFTSALKLKATESLSIEAVSALKSEQLRLLVNATKVYNSRNNLVKKASLLEQDADAFRKAGEAQGRTRLVITKDSLLTLVRKMHPSGIIEDSLIMKSYLEFITSKFGTYKAKHFEIYTQDSKITNNKGTISSLITENSDKDIIAFRGLNFSHANTLTHIDQYLRSIGAFTGISTTISKKAISSEFERGHVYAQTTGRQLLSIGGISEDNTILDKLIGLSLQLDKASSSLRNPIYAVLDAEITKDFSSTKVFMNVEFQPRFSTDGTGNQDTGKIAGGLQLINSMLKLLDNMSYTGRGRLNSVPIISQVTQVAKSFENLLLKLNKQTEAMEKVLKGYIDDPAKYLLDLKSSKSLKQHVTDSIVSSISGKPNITTKVKHPATKVYSNKTTGVSKVSSSTAVQSLKKTKKELSEIALALKSKVNPIRTTSGQFYSLANLQMLINTHLQDVISANMGNGSDTRILNYRTGRFAASAQVERMSQSREGAITAYYSYMNNPYATFEPTGKQGSPKTRDPRLLIAGSIREIAATKVGNKLRAVSI